MLSCTTGDLLRSDAEALVNTVNCEGYMGKGLAYQLSVSFRMLTTIMLQLANVAICDRVAYVGSRKREKSLSIFQPKINGERNQS